MTAHDLLFELFTEELPPKTLKTLINNLADQIATGLKQAQLSFTTIIPLATPRRLAIIIKQLAETQPTQQLERKGPALAQAYDKNGQATAACLGFIKSCGIELNQVSTLKTDKGEWLYYKGERPGVNCQQLIPDIIHTALKQLPIAKPMFWGNHPNAFVRPVHGVLLLYGNTVINTDKLFGLTTQQITYGHRFMQPDPIKIISAASYCQQLEQTGYVLADMTQRQMRINNQINQLIEQQFHGKAKALIPASLLDEVTALVEWPVVLLCQFATEFLSVPKEALIASMQDHQKCFALIDNATQQLLPYFITVSNIISTDTAQVIKGNERVMHARLSDAKFFYDTDSKLSLAAQLPKLKTITYQAKLGTVWDKTLRLMQLIQKFAQQLTLDPTETRAAQRAAELCKADLVTQMVGEFPELQGIMGAYYAQQDGENKSTAQALRDYYQPRHAQDSLPSSQLGQLLAIADRIDTLVGTFGLNQLPTGDKDPFGLRRTALGILKILLEQNITLDLSWLISQAEQAYPEARLINTKLKQQVLQFFYDRFSVLVKEKGIAADIVLAVQRFALQTEQHQVTDLWQRMQAVQAFKQLAVADSLIQANKRVNNLLNKQANASKTSKISNTSSLKLDNKLLTNQHEIALHQAIVTQQAITKQLLVQQDYQAVLLALSKLAPSIDCFFTEVLVMCEDQTIRENRLALLYQLRALFLQVADIAELN